MSRPLKILLIGSLVLNLLLGGALVGEGMRHSSLFGHRFAVEGGSLSALPEEKRQLLEEAMAHVHEQGQQMAPEMEKVRRELMAVLVAPTFDEKAYAEKLEQLEKLRRDFRHHMAEVTRHLAKQFSQKERQALAEHLRHVGRSKHAVTVGDRKAKSSPPAVSPAKSQP